MIKHKMHEPLIKFLFRNHFCSYNKHAAKLHQQWRLFDSEVNDLFSFVLIERKLRNYVHLTSVFAFLDVTSKMSMDIQ